MKNMRTGPALPVERELVLLGGGHSHVAVIRQFGMSPLPGVRLTVVSRDVHTPYSGMLPGLIAGHYRLDECHIDLRTLCEANGVRLIQATASGIDLARRQVLVDGRPPLDYDWLSINTGSRPALDTIPGAAEHGIAVKPIDRFLIRWESQLAQLRASPQHFRLLVVGAGAAGIEVSLACAYRLRAALSCSTASVDVQLLSAAPRLLETHNERVRDCFGRILARSGITPRLGARVASAQAGGVRLEDGTAIEADLVVWAIQAGAPRWPRESGLDCDRAGFIRVDTFLRSTGDERVFAAGDVAALPEAVAKSGVYAVREGGVLAHNLRHALLGRALRPYRPQRRFLSLLSTGPRHAVASRGALSASGAWVWRWKDRIDRRFMAMYRAQAVPAPLPGEAPAMRCGGCAAKVDSAGLGAALRTLPEQPREEVLFGRTSAEDAAVLAPPPGQRLVQSVDYFRAFIDDPWLLGRIGAVHCLADLHAMGARPHSALAIATVPHASPAVMQATLRQLMQGAMASLQEEGVVLLGGHSNEGETLGFGLSVNGFAGDAELLLKGGLRDGHALLLTKPLGTGTLLAANMAAAAEGRWVEHALGVMQRGHGAALAVLRAHGVAACTDVTGFGLLGHLGEMLQASGIGARLDLSALPALPGARECINRGYLSSAHQGNRVHLDLLQSPAARLERVDIGLLLDPQTAGGLLAAVPAERAQACVAALRHAGFPETVLIGRCDAALAPGRVATG